MKRVLELGERLAAQRAQNVAEGLEKAVRGVVPEDVAVGRSEDGVYLEGRRLAARMLRDPRLRAIGLEAREWLR